MATIAISEFRRKCLQLLKDLPEEGLTVTSRGKPVAEVKPAAREKNILDYLGTIPDLRRDPNDDLFSTGIRWDAESRHPHRSRRRRG